VLSTVKHGTTMTTTFLTGDSTSGDYSKLPNFKNLRQNFTEAKKSLIFATLQNLDQFITIEEESLAMIRKILLVLSFYQVNGLVSSFFEFIHSTKENYSEEGAVSVFLRPVSGIIEVLAGHLSAIMLATIIGPISTTLPRIFLRGIISPFLSATRSFINDPKKLLPLKTGFLRIAVSIQQQLLIIFQSVLEKELDARRKIVEICCEEFERVRRYISMIDAPSQEIQVRLFHFLCLKFFFH
jgi:hypothetical protein